MLLAAERSALLAWGGLRPAALPGMVLVCALGGFIALALALLLSLGDGLALDRLWSRYTLRVLSFTLTQTAWSVGLSLLGAVPLAVLLHRYPRFAGRGLVVRMLTVPLALPPLVAVLALLDVWGRAGLVSGLFNALGLDVRPSVFGLHGVVLAHVFFNLPLAARLTLAHMDRQPGTLFRLADQLGLHGWSRFRRLEWPLLHGHLAGIGGLVGMLCIGSFTIVLTLGGGPSAATFEVAIYQALTFDFDPPLAVLYTLVQLGLAGVMLAIFSLVGGVPQDRAGALDARLALVRPLPVWGIALLVGLFALLLVPLMALAISGLAADWTRLLSIGRLWSALGTSLIIGCCAALLATLASYGLLVARARGFASPSLARALFDAGFRLLGSAVLVVPPIVLGAGWFLALRGLPMQSQLAGLLVMLVNALMALPFVLRVLGPALEASERRYGPLCASLGLSGWSRFVRVDGPVLLRPFIVALIFALVLSIGDLGAAALFGAYDLVTLPVLILNLMGSYRTGDAAGVALLLGVFVLALILTAERAGRVME